MENPDNHQPKPASRNLIFALLPLVIFLALAVIFYKQLAGGGATSDLPSALIGKPAPSDIMEPLIGLLVDGNQLPGISPDLFLGKVSLINVWSSWCVPCRQEHPLLVELGKTDKVQLIGLNYKDSTENALRFLGQLGNPFDAVGVDPKGRAAIDWGVYGVPETFLVGPDGTIILKHVGPLSEKSIAEMILPAIDNATK